MPRAAMAEYQHFRARSTSPTLSGGFSRGAVLRRRGLDRTRGKSVRATGPVRPLAGTYRRDHPGNNRGISHPVARTYVVGRSEAICARAAWTMSAPVFA